MNTGQKVGIGIVALIAVVGGYALFKRKDNKNSDEDYADVTIDVKNPDMSPRAGIDVVMSRAGSTAISDIIASGKTDSKGMIVFKDVLYGTYDFIVGSVDRRTFEVKPTAVGFMVQLSPSSPPPPSPPSQPRNTRGTRTSPDEAQISWDTPENDGGSPILKYQVDSCTGTTFDILPTEVSMTVSKPDPVSYPTCWYRVRAFNANGASNYGEQVIIDWR